MKEKKVGDVIVFDYDVYDIENNIEFVYDHTDTLKGIVEGIIPDPRYTKYRVKLLSVLNAANPKDYENSIGTSGWVASDDKVYRGTALFNLLYPTLRKPTVDQVKFIMSFFNDPNDAESIVKYLWLDRRIKKTNEGYQFGIETFQSLHDIADLVRENPKEWIDLAGSILNRGVGSSNQTNAIRGGSAVR